MHVFNSTFKPIVTNPCLLCDLKTAEKTLICDACFVELPQPIDACYQCGLPLHSTAPRLGKMQICGNCLTQAPHFDYTIAPFLYAQPMDYLIQQFKFSGQLVAGYALSKLMLKIISPLIHGRPQAIMPVPLHAKKLKSRGYNQAQELACPIAKALAIDLDLTSCARLKDTQPQSGLSKTDRIINMQNAFTLRKPIVAEHVVLIDDIMTTGNTLNELAKQLKRAGVKKVGIWVCARAILD